LLQVNAHDRYVAMEYKILEKEDPYVILQALYLQILQVFAASLTKDCNK